MHLVVVSVDPVRFAKMAELYPGAELFAGVTGCTEKMRHINCTPKTYQNLARHAVEQGWGVGTVVMQDDVLVVNFDQGEGDFVVYGQTSWKTNGVKLHVCPKAFRASPEIWKLLAEHWDGRFRICDAWMPIVDDYGQVLDVTARIDG